MYNFTYHSPSSLQEAENLLALEGATALAGGQTLLPTLKHRLAQPSALVDLKKIEELHGIRDDGAAIVIGATTTHCEVMESELIAARIPVLAHLAGGIGDPQVRHRGTIGGSVANNDPAADYPAGCLGLGATIYTSSRKIVADEFFLDLFETALEDGELIVAISFPVPEKACYMKFPNPASRYAMVGVMVSKTGSNVRVAVTGAGSNGVFREKSLESALGDDFSSDAIKESGVDETDLISDIHGSAEYRKHLIAEMARRAVMMTNGG